MPSPIRAALAADGRAEQTGQAVTLNALGEFGVGEGEGLSEGIGQRSIGAGAPGFGLGRGFFMGGVRHRTVYKPSY